jgi:glutamate dehydrogenase
MKDMPNDLRGQTLALINENGSASQSAGSAQVNALIAAWLESLDDEDLAGTAPHSLAPVLVDGFSQLAQRTGPGAQIATMGYSDGRGGMTARTWSTRSSWHCARSASSPPAS